MLLSLMRAAGRDCTAGLAQVMHSELLVPLLGAAAGPSPAMLSNGTEGSTAFPLVPIGPVAPQNGATVYPFSKSAVLRRLLSDQVGFWMNVLPAFRRLLCGVDWLIHFSSIPPPQSACYIFHRMVNGLDEFV